MIEVSGKIRQAFYSALNGNVTVSATPIPVYSDFNPNENEDKYILLSTQTEADIRNKKKFITDGTILIDIVHIQQAGALEKDTLDTMAGQIENIVDPTISSNGLSAPSGVQFLNIKKLSTNDITLPSANNTVVRRLIRYQLTVQEN